MKKIEYYVLSTILLLSGCSDIYTSSFNSSNVNNWVKDENIILNNEVCIFIDESYSIVTYTDYDYNWLIEDKTVLEYCSNATFKCLKEGRTTIKAETEDGKYDECIVNIINKDNIKNADDFYLIDDFNLNFMTLYVYENNNGIIQYYFNVNEYDESKDAIYNLIELFYNDENNKGILSSTGLLSSESLQYGDKIICHYNYRKSKVYTIPPQLEVYNLFYTGDNVEFI